ncbi:putative GRASP-type PDZ domain, PDZ superfamily protein [Septoria linicola]|nr:putative GRASP-type PDZ domain, PDZ superfamily protein [Septoria linicola]
MANLFGTLNRFISRLDSDPDAANATSQPSAPSSRNHYGFQILRNTNSSIALEPWFDFIIGINGHNIDNPDPNLFMTEVRNCAGSTISLGVFGAKGSQIREVYLTVPPAGDALGLALQWAPLDMVNDVWHILDVMPNSPADVAGLLPYSDYVIGSPDTKALRGDAALGQLVEAYMNSTLRLWVYNQEYDVTRMVTITPARNWGGEGSLGCILGYGALHRIPAPLEEPSTGPGETMFDGDVPPAYASQPGSESSSAPPPSGGDFLVPANMDLPGTSPSPSLDATSAPPKGPPAGKARKARAHHTPASGLDDYFAEGEQKSRELDGGSTPKASNLLPPPPKAGGPPKAASSAPPTDDEVKAET